MFSMCVLLVRARRVAARLILSFVPLGGIESNRERRSSSNLDISAGWRFVDVLDGRPDRRALVAGAVHVVLVACRAPVVARRRRTVGNRCLLYTSPSPRDGLLY